MLHPERKSYHNCYITCVIRDRSAKGQVMAPSDPANRIAALRKHLGLLQTQFADLFGVTQAAVSQWESGYREPSGQIYIRMGNLANDGDCVWFWERGGVDIRAIERWIASRKSPANKSSRT